MAWDEALFSLFWDGARQALSSAPPADVLARRVEVDDAERARLEALARLLTGRAVTVAITDDEPSATRDVFLVPRVVDFAPTLTLNRAALVARVTWASVATQLGVPPCESLVELARHAVTVRAAMLERFPSLSGTLPVLEQAAALHRPLPPPTDRRAQAIEATVRLALGQTEHPALPPDAWAFARQQLAQRAPPLPDRTRAWFARDATPPLVPLWLWLRPSLVIGATKPGLEADADALPNGSELKKQRKATVQRVDEPPEALAENPLVHSFEKVHTLDEYKGGSKRVDGDDELSAHQKALEELDLRQVVRSRQRAKSLYRADVLLDGRGESDDGATTEPAEAHYDEWDEGKRCLKPRWCRLTTRVLEVGSAPSTDLSELRARLARSTRVVRAAFEHLEAARAWKPRQRHGADINLDALTARHGALRAGECNEARLYVTRRRRSRETAVLVLLDASLSTDAWVENRRVLDVEKQAVVLVGDALDGLFDDVEVAAFTSQTRRDCRYLVAKRFDDSWDVGARRLMALEPRGFTRIGPAVRHATHRLLEQPSRQKLLIVISDGKPSDVDHYEGRYGVADVRHAVLDAQTRGVTTHALAVDPSAREWLPSLFGHGHASVVSTPDDMALALVAVVKRGLAR